MTGENFLKKIILGQNDDSTELGQIEEGRGSHFDPPSNQRQPQEDSDDSEATVETPLL